MLALIFLGWAAWIKRRKSLIVATAILTAMAFWQGSLLQYDYGLYKILFIGSLIWIPSLFRGGTAAAAFVPTSMRPVAVTVGTIVFLGATMAQRAEQQGKIPWREIKPVKWYSELADIKHRVGNRPVLLECNSIFDQEYNDFDQEWAVYFLRNINLKLPEYLGYFTTSERLMRRAKSVDEPVDFVLINEPLEGAVWKNERFSLFELGSEAKVIGVRGVDGVKQVNGKPFVWLGNKASRFLIVSKIAETATFTASECLTGPSDSRQKDAQIQASINGSVQQVDVSGVFSIEVLLKPGLNILDLVYQDTPTVSAPSSGDPKARPLGLWDYRISSKPRL
jgi:hypothetical protein